MSKGSSELAFAALGLAVLGLAVAVGVRDVDDAAAVWDEMGPLAPGSEIPRFRASLVDGGVIDNDELEGQVTLLNFWATWCGVCEQQMPAIASLDRRYKDSGVRVIGVNQDREGDQEEKVLDYLAAREMTLAMALDSGTMGRAFRVSMIPHVAIVDRKGELRFVHQGRVGEDTLAEELDELLNE